MKLRLLGLLAIVAIASVAAPAGASAQQPTKVWRIGLLSSAPSDPASAARWKAFRERLGELGYVEGQNVVFEFRWGDGQVGRLRGLVGELIGAKVDLLVTVGSEAARAAKSLGVVVQGICVRNPRDLDAAFLAMKRARADAVILGGNTEFIADRRRLADLAIKHRLPMMVAAREYAEAGALISYGTDYLDLFLRAAVYVDKILRGTKRGELPIEQPTKFELVINLKTAKALGLALPQSLVQRADEVIQ